MTTIYLVLDQNAATPEGFEYAKTISIHDSISEARKKARQEKPCCIYRGVRSGRVNMTEHRNLVEVVR